MFHWICSKCGTQYNAASNPPLQCEICMDERQYVGREGQEWITLEQLQADGYKTEFKEEETNLIGIGIIPKFAIGQRALLVQTTEGNVLWDCIPFIDEDTELEIRRLGGLTAIAISHPHYYSTMAEWAERFEVPIYVHEDDRKWVFRESKWLRFWSGESYRILPGVTLVRLGGHFPGSAVLHWSEGAEGEGSLLTGDTIYVVEDRKWVSFMYSYPNLIPLSADTILRIKEAIAEYRFDRLYSAWFGKRVESDARRAVLKSAERYILGLKGHLDGKYKGASEKHAEQEQTAVELDEED